jgi:RNA polymerase sigma-70 factor (ECF subfamily)
MAAAPARPVRASGPDRGIIFAVDPLTRLALAAREGDRTALAAFVERSQADVWRFCAHQLGREHADDATQETFLRAIGALRTFRGDASARTWLLSIARRVCADVIRRTVRRRRLFHRVTAQPLEMAQAHGHEADLDDLLAALSPDRRSAFVLTQLLGLSYDEAAEVCGCPVGTIRSRVARARDDLVGQLGEPGRAAKL